ncbi:MAG: patatin-like phospholipase family protein [Candidatus Rhabdochlamydia sp.]
MHSQLQPSTPTISSLTQKMDEREDGMLKTLAIDGGGIRGIIPLKVLGSLEKMIGPLKDTFDLIGGSSTGGIIALALATPFQSHSVDKILEIYTQHATEVFTHNPHHSGTLAKFLANKVGSQKVLQTLMDSPLYASHGREKLLGEYLGESFMKQATTNVLITAVDITDTVKPDRFTNFNPHYSMLAMRDVAMATSAAPMYFNHKIIRGRKWIDGGICNNNPAMECFKHAEKHGIDAKHQSILSIGTGFTDIKGLSEDHHNLLYWATSIFPVVELGHTNQINEELSTSLGTNFHRIQPRLDQEIDLDDCSAQSLDQLCAIGDELVEIHFDSLRDLAKSLRPDKF